MGAGSAQLAEGHRGHFAVPGRANKSPDVFSKGLSFLWPILSSRYFHERESVPFNPSPEHPLLGLYLLVPAQQPSISSDHTHGDRFYLPISSPSSFLVYNTKIRKSPDMML